MRAIRRFTVRTVLPESLRPLDELSANLRWSWHEPVRRLFEEASPELWRRTGHDPIAMLGLIEPDRIAQLAADREFVARAEELRDELHRYLAEPRWYGSLAEAPEAIAYFSPEFGIATALPQYSGGLGILAGDHLKSASDLGVPLTGVGLFYRAGYFRQAISPDGWQLESYPVLDPDGLPLGQLTDEDGPVVVSLDITGGRVLRARIRVASVGRVTLLLLDTDVPENDESLRGVTDRLYGGGGEHRLLQELLLGVGGVRALRAFSRVTGAASPAVFHTNEGHAGFQGLERVRELIETSGLAFDEALQAVRAGTVFTTHTPVPAGIDRFDRGLVGAFLDAGVLAGVATDDALALGAENTPGGSHDVFNMAIMGLRLGQHANGVSKLHGAVSRGMFAGLWPGFSTDDVPITSVTNGVHAPTWTDPAVQALAARTLGTTDTTRADWASDALTDADLWSLRGDLREQLVLDARRRLVEAWRAQNPGGLPPAWLGEVLDPKTLTIGFARRVPTYKRLTLMLQDPERLTRILTNRKRPVQIVIAGKSHPADDGGKELIQRLVQFMQNPAVRDRIVFLPDYDIGMAQVLYPGTDVWLNNPLRPLEACGTSGMKAALNGALNLSILDGWWDEYFDGENGWAIPSADAAGSQDDRDRVEAEALYDLIEHQIAPRFYRRDSAGLPTRWLKSIRHTLATLSPELSADRMVREYVERLYLPAAVAASAVAADGHGGARALAAWKRRVHAAWPDVHVALVESAGLSGAPEMGDGLQVRARVRLGSVDPSDVAVQVVHGRATQDDVLYDTEVLDLAHEGEDDGHSLFAGSLELARAGSFGYTVRVVPRHELLADPAELGLVAFATV